MVQAQTRNKWSEGPKALALMRCFHSRRATVFKELSNENSAQDKINPSLISGALTVAAGIETGPIALGVTNTGSSVRVPPDFGSCACFEPVRGVARAMRLSLSDVGEPQLLVAVASARGGTANGKSPDIQPAMEIRTDWGRDAQKSRETAKLVLYASKSLLGKCETRWIVGSIKPASAVL